jgi:hypothetical protein
MKRIALVASTALLLGLGTSAMGLGVRLDDCSALPPEIRLFERYPDLTAACDSIVQLDGRRYLRMNAELRQVRDDLLVLRLKGTLRDMVLSPGAAESIVPGGGNGGLSPTLPAGSALNVYVPEKDVLGLFAEPGKRDGSPVSVAVEPAEPLEKRIATYTCCPRRDVPWYPIPEFLPMTAGPLPLLGLIGVSLLGVGAALRHRRLHRR